MFHIVDDSDAMCRFYRAVVEEFGHTAAMFSSPLAYLGYMRSPEYEAPTALIAEAITPLMDGYRLIEQVIERYPGTRTAVITAYDGKRPGNQRHVCLHLRKPVSIESLHYLFQALTLCGHKGPHHAKATCQEVDQRYSSGWTCPRTCR